jgi:hypothetical protein
VDGVVNHIQELQADGRNNSQYLRQNHSDDTLDMPEKVRIVGWVQVTDDTE